MSKHRFTALLRRDARATRVGLVVAAAIACSGCGLTAKKEVTASIPTPVDYRQRHPIAIKDGERTMEMFVGGRRGVLTPTQRADVVAFAEAWRHEGTGGLLIEVPSGTPNARAASEAMREVRGVRARAGGPGGAVAARGYRPSDPGRLATLKVTYPRMTAQAGPCGYWPEDLGLPHDAQPTMNRPYWNLGCSSQRNLAAMVDNPADLVQPRGEGPIYTPRRTTVMEKYRAGMGPATTYQDAGKGTISDVGK
jgi:pilus assembly protein CpaD